jgi:hypothetical protein
MPFGLTTNYDSVWFSCDSGLCRRSNSICIDHDEWGSVYWSTFDFLSRILVSVNESPQSETESLTLANYPNPFNPATTVAYELQNSVQVRLVVYDLLGRQVAVLANEFQRPGRHQYLFDGSHLANGMYFLRLYAAGHTQTHSMILLK